MKRTEQIAKKIAKPPLSAIAVVAVHLADSEELDELCRQIRNGTARDNHICFYVLRLLQWLSACDVDDPAGCGNVRECLATMEEHIAEAEQERDLRHERFVKECREESEEALRKADAHSQFFTDPRLWK
jgi:hypothetical protein